ncbi:LTA synthase family protein [Gelidibacter gilvus]|uniref:LTA synthase family protein n=1 Tax=Gelidibacter gilvus TaxID=59602 RepID=UPI00167D4FA6|nr:sulfatase [Gelidibacter gilvus]
MICILSANLLAYGAPPQDRLTSKDSSSNLSSYTLIEKEFNYLAPESGNVYLVWQIEGIELSELLTLNDHSKLTDGLLYTPMQASEEGFKVKLKVPATTHINYDFWSTKNKQGHYIDHWDLKSRGRQLVTDDTPIIKQAHYVAMQTKSASRLISKGWLLLAFLMVLYFLWYVLQKRRVEILKSPTPFESILFIGLSLLLLLALARSEILGLNPTNYLNNPKLIIDLVRGSFSDFTFVATITLIFGLATLLTNPIKIKNSLRLIFIILAVGVTIAAFVNITNIILLGKPFTYQWLYYSDFLGSDEAKTAFKENISVGIVLNLIAYGVSLLLLARLLYIAYQLLKSKKHVKYTIFSFLGLGLISLVWFASETQVSWSKGQSQNAITAFVQSMFTANSKASFFTLDLTTEEEAFDPAKSTLLEKPRISNEHGVKNVVVIVLESAGAEYFDAYGGRFGLSPNLNKYAEQALIFDQMYAHSPATNFSLVSMLASMYPDLSFKSITQEHPEINHPTMSSRLKEEGYRTSFFTSADLRFQNCDTYLAHRGFDLVEDFSKITCEDHFQLADTSYKEGNGINDLCLADRFSTWIDEDPNQNFFSMLWTVQGHYPYFFEDEEQDFGVSNLSFNRYLNCLKRNDELVGAVMQFLEDKGLASSTLVVVTGDHGEAFGQHSQYGHGTGIYEENLKVPLYLINHTLFNGERIKDIAGMKDLATTVLPMLGMAVPEIWQGRNLLSSTSNEAYFFAPWSDYLFGYRNGDLKYIFNETENTVQVYNLKNDPKELHNLYHNEMEAAIIKARSKVASWVQFQDKFMTDLLQADQ